MKLETALEVIANELMHGNYTPEGYDGCSREGFAQQEIETMVQLIQDHNLPIELEPAIEALKVYARTVVVQENPNMFNACQTYQRLTTPSRGPRY